MSKKALTHRRSSREFVLFGLRKLWPCQHDRYSLMRPCEFNTLIGTYLFLKIKCLEDQLLALIHLVARAYRARI